MTGLACMFGGFIVVWAFYVMAFGGSKDPQDSVPPERYEP